MNGTRMDLQCEPFFPVAKIIYRIIIFSHSEIVNWNKRKNIYFQLKSFFILRHRAFVGVIKGSTETDSALLLPARRHSTLPMIDATRNGNRDTWWCNSCSNREGLLCTRNLHTSASAREPRCYLPAVSKRVLSTPFATCELHQHDNINNPY